LRKRKKTLGEADVKRRARTLAAGLGAICLGLGLATAARAADCAILPSIPARLAGKDSVKDYLPVLRVCHSGDVTGVAIRSMRLGGERVLLLADPETLSTRLAREGAACWTCEDASEGQLAGTRLMRAIEASAKPPPLADRGFLQNAGLTHGETPGVYLTGDLCPSSRPLERDFLDGLATKQPGAPVALSLSGLWLTHHFSDFQWLLQRQAAGAFTITWTDHTYHHVFKRGVPNARNFMLTPKTYPAEDEILDTEKLLIANGQVPSLFFRFPGLISSAPLMRTARDLHLVALGADAWLALNQQPKAGSIVLVHPNGNEPLGLKLFDRDWARGEIPTPLKPLAEAPD
jgi:hypothetical protein